MAKPVTTFDVARKAGVSRTTVSHVLNKHPRVSLRMETRERVLKAVRDLGYVPNSAAQMLVTGRSQIIGLILSRPELLSVAYVPPLILGMNEVLQAHRYRLLIEIIRDPKNPDVYLDLVKSKPIDGLIIINPRKEDVALQKTIDSKFPILCLGASGNPNEAAIATEDKATGRRATEHLLSLGHRRIAHITYASLAYTPAQSRFEGYRSALQAMQVSFDPKLFAEGDFTYESGYLAMRKIFAQGGKPTALFAGSDEIALGAMTAVREAGFSIPEEFGVIGYDDIPAAAFAIPPLTTMRAFPFEHGKIGAEAAINLINGKKSGRTSPTISLELVVRESCGARLLGSKSRRSSARAARARSQNRWRKSGMATKR
jgi:DNA-binding LacI/PurR family transcriptional regulator